MNSKRPSVAYAKTLPAQEERDYPVGLHLGSLIGHMRNIMGVENHSYLYADDEELYAEIVDTLCGLCYECAKEMLASGVKFDYAHYWEDICFKNGPLVSPHVFRELVGPWYKKINDMVNNHGIDIISLDCDGCIDALVPIWLENGVNTMFPIEVGTWNASIAPWREKYGRELRGVGGMNKTVFARDKKAVEQEVERLKSLIDLGGFIPCPDHRIAPDAKFELVQYYCELMRKL
jgi:uroporphyrinogen decarboxylase